MKKLEIFKKENGDLLVEVIAGSIFGDKIDGFDRVEEKTQDAATEKHVPFVEEHEDVYSVRIGKDAAHPMTDEHYIQFIEILVDDERLYRQYLKAGDKPEAYFKVEKGKKVVAREHCNLHGLWRN
ncbi:MAG: desulfoferrodoxin family protein [Fusobacteriaceae bacterium]